jgi:hypothetical protein
MRSVKKFVAFALVVGLATTAVGCGKDKAKGDGGSTTTTQAGSAESVPSTSATGDASGPSGTSGEPPIFVQVYQAVSRDVKESNGDACRIYAATLQVGAAGKPQSKEEAKVGIAGVVDILTAVGGLTDPALGDVPATLHGYIPKIEAAAKDADYDPAKLNKLPVTQEEAYGKAIKAFNDFADKKCNTTTTTAAH